MIHIDVRNKRGSSKDKAMSEEEFKTLKNSLDRVTELKKRVILFLGARAGLRVSEIIQCRLSWINLKTINNREVLEINIPNKDKDIKNLKKVWYVKDTSREGKNKQRTTYLFNSDEMHEVLNFYVHNPKGIEYSRQHINTQIVKKHFSKILKKSKEEELTAHSLRATAQNYFYFSLNLDNKFIQLIMGHEDIRTTLKHYTTMNKASGEAYLTNVLNNIS